jgi:hypothetical protein
LKPLGNVPASELPAEFQDLLDSSKPLTVEHFAPRLVNAPFWALLLIPCLPLAIGSLGMISGGYESIRLVAGSLIFAAPLVPLIWLMRVLAVRRGRYVRRVRSGELRLGLFVHPDAILVRTRENSCFLLPRNFLRGVIYDRYFHMKGALATRLIFIGADGKQYADIVGRNAFGIYDRFEHYEDLIDALRRWKPNLEIVKQR